MSDNNSILASVLKARSNPTNEEAGQLVAKAPPISTAKVPLPVVEAAQVNIAPDFKQEQGILAQWKAKQMDRRSALAVLETRYAGHLEVVKHQVMEQVKVGKQTISVKAEELLNELDVKHLEIMSQLGMRNVSIRQKMMTDATQMTVSQIREVEGKDWPDELKADVITKALDLKEKFVNKIMAEADFGPQS